MSCRVALGVTYRVLVFKMEDDGTDFLNEILDSIENDKSLNKHLQNFDIQPAKKIQNDKPKKDSNLFKEEIRNLLDDKEIKQVKKTSKYAPLTTSKYSKNEEASNFLNEVLNCVEVDKSLLNGDIEIQRAKKASKDEEIKTSNNATIEDSNFLNEVLNSVEVDKTLLNDSELQCAKKATKNDFLNEVFSSVEVDESLLNGEIQPAKRAEKSSPKNEEPPRKVLKDINIPFLDKESNEKIIKKTSNEPSLIHKGDTDSSDDEDNKYFEESNYSSCGKTIKNIIKKSENTDRHSLINFYSQQPVEKDINEPKMFGIPKKKVTEKKDIMMEPFFGMRLINPLFSSVTLHEKMSGRTPVSFHKLKHHVKHASLKSDWVIAGVIVSQSPPKISQKGSKYVIWTLSDLREGLKTACVFLFGKSYDKLWKTTIGTVIGILNPNVLSQKDSSKDEATLSVMSPDQVMIWGQSKDLGRCKGKKKNGDKCSAFINLNHCEYCIYHVQSEYRKYSSRAELQSPTCGLQRNKLRNKVLGKNEIFYGGQSFTSLPEPGGSKKLKTEDVKKLNVLGFNPKLPQAPKNDVDIFSLNTRGADLLNMLKNGNTSQAMKDKERLKLLSKPEGKTLDKRSASPLLSLPQPMLTNPEKDLDVWAKKPSKPIPSTSTLSTNPKSNLQTKFNSLLSITSEKKSKKIENLPEIEKSEPVNQPVVKPVSPQTSAQMSRAKLKALAFIQKNGKISKKTPTGLTREEIVKKNLKRVREDDTEEEPPAKQIFSERFIELMKKETKHKDLVELNDKAEEDAYYLKMEKKEQMEEKMTNTFKIDCKAVSCLKCKYTWFSASDACKEERHPLRVVDGVKRFFKCAKCSNRTVSLNILPMIPCTKCGASSWEKTSMMKERSVQKCHQLSIRGGEQSFMNSVVQNGSLDLLVPDES